MDRDGFAVLPWRLEPELHAELLSALDTIWEKAQTDGPLESLHYLSFLGADPVFPSIVDWPPLLRVVTDLLTNNIYVNHSHLDVHPPHEPTSGMRWHRDGGVQGSDMKIMPDKQPRLTVKVGYFLTDVPDAEHGALEVVPGSHKDSYIRSLNKEPEPNTHSILVPAGSVAMFDARVIHRRHDNLSGVARKAMFLAFTYRWVTSRDDSLMDHPDWPRWSPVRHQMLGDPTWEPFYPRREDLPLAQWRIDAGPAPEPSD